MTLPLRRLGAGAPAVSAIGLGCMGLSGGYGSPAGEVESASAIRRALDFGHTLLNTADFYGVGENERLVGRAIADRRSAAFVSTKIGVQVDERGAPTRINGRPEYLRQACEASLQRLGIESIDLIILCRVDRQVPIEESVGELSRLVAEGKARYIGLSEAAAGTVRRAHAVHPLAALESEYSLWERHVEIEILPTLRERDIALLAYSPLGRGFLTAAFSKPFDFGEFDIRPYWPRFQEGNFERNSVRLQTLRVMAAEKSVSPAQLALAWLLAKDPQTIPIPGTRRAAHVEENAHAVSLQLTQADVQRLDASFPPMSAAGARYPELFLVAIDEGEE